MGKKRGREVVPYTRVGSANIYRASEAWVWIWGCVCLLAGGAPGGEGGFFAEQVFDLIFILLMFFVRKDEEYEREKARKEKKSQYVTYLIGEI